MLDLSKIIGQVKDMSENLRENQNANRDRLGLGHRLLGQVNWQELALRVQASRTSMLLARPVGNLSEVFPCPALPKAFTVVAADGSQIVPDHHGPALCFLINSGLVMLHYGTGERPLLQSKPQLFFRDEDIYLEIGGRRVLIQGELLSAKRSQLEALCLEELLVEASSRQHPVVALEDGSLIKWTLEQGEEWQNRLLECYLKTLSTARELGIPVCGYLSGSRAADVVNCLKLVLCPEFAVDCDKCQYTGKEAPCSQLEGLSDTMLFKRLLSNRGERSQVFFSSSKVLESYGEHKIGFFYLNTGQEIARVEFPAWVWKQQELLRLVHAAAADQAEKGKGYPVALIEAHEQAVVKGADRDAFLRLLETAMIRQGIPVQHSPKSLRKRVGYV